MGHLGGQRSFCKSFFAELNKIANVIVECAVCKSCLWRHLDTSIRCPTCTAVIHRTNPCVNIRLVLTAVERINAKDLYAGRYPYHLAGTTTQPEMLLRGLNNRMPTQRLNVFRIYIILCFVLSILGINWAAWLSIVHHLALSCLMFKLCKCNRVVRVLISVI